MGTITIITDWVYSSTEVENCNVLAGLVSTSGLQVTSSTSKTFQNAIISSQAFWFNDWFQI